MTNKINTLFQQARDAVDGGNWAEGVRLYLRHLQQRPEHAEAHYEIAWLWRMVDEPLRALNHYRTALELGAEKPEEIYLNIAVIYSEELGDHDAAMTSLETALRKRPHYVEALLNLGNLHEEVGSLAQALQCYREILTRETPQLPIFHAALGRSLSLCGKEVPADQRALAETLLQQPGQVSSLAELCFGLAQVEQADRNYAAAFARYEQANRLNAMSTLAYDPAHQEKMYAAIASDLAKIQIGGTTEHRGSGLKPLFVVGMFRSGSTLIEQVLNAHPSVHAFGEISFLPRLVQNRLQPYPATLAELSNQTLTEWRQHYQARFARRALTPQVRYCIDKRPDNFLYLGLIKRLFPEAKIIHTVRNPIDNALSIFQQQLDPRVAPYASTLEGIAHNYGQYQRLMQLAKTRFDADLFEFDYDDFVQQPEPTLRRLLDFLELPWEPTCLQFHLQKQPVKTASLWQVRQPINTASLGRWRLYETQLSPLIDALKSNQVTL